MHLGLMNVKGNDDEDDALQEPLWCLCGPNDCSNTYHHVVVVVVFYDDNDNDNDDDNDDNDNCGNGGGSVGCSSGDNYFKTEDYLYNNYNLKKCCTNLVKGVRFTSSKDILIHKF